METVTVIFASLNVFPMLATIAETLHNCIFVLPYAYRAVLICGAATAFIVDVCHDVLKTSGSLWVFGFNFSHSQ